MEHNPNVFAQAYTPMSIPLARRIPSQNKYETGGPLYNQRLPIGSYLNYVAQIETTTMNNFMLDSVENSVLRNNIF